MSNNNPNKSNKPGPDRFQPKVLLIWLVIFSVIIGVWTFTGQQRVGEKNDWSINEVFQAIEANEVQTITIVPDPTVYEFYTITGKLKTKTTAEAIADKDTANESKAAAAPAETFQAKGRLTQDRYNALVNTNQPVEVIEAQPDTFMRELFSWLPIILIFILIYVLFIRQLRNAGKGAMSFGKSKARMLTRDKDKVTFKDVAGCDEAKVEVSEIVDFLRDPKKFTKIGGRVPKGILMVGPPGTGKTLLGKAVAGEADVPFFSISGSDFVEMFVGVGAARVRDMFEQGRKNAPCIIFIDEIDAVGRQRGAGHGGGNDEREQTLNSLLVEMDGFESQEGIIIMAATNRPDVLDKALMRPGRFDRQITIDLPDMNGREEILKVHAKKIKIEDEVDMNLVARNTPGFSGADLANLLNESALIAARMDKAKVDMRDLNEAREKISFGTERRKKMDEDDRRSIAYHEAGHALVQVAMGDKNRKLHKVTIIPRGRALGMAMYVPTKDLLGSDKQELLNHICSAMAGRIGEEIVTGDYSNGASGDIQQATRVARAMVCEWGMSELGPVALHQGEYGMKDYSEETARKIDDTVRTIINEQFDRAVKIIEDHKEELRIISEALLEHETLDGKHVEEIMEHGKIISEVRTMNQYQEKEAEKKKDENAETEEEKKKGDELGPDAPPLPA